MINTILIYTLSAVVAVSMITLYFVNKKKNWVTFKKFFKIIAFITLAFALVRMQGGRAFIYNHFYLVAHVSTFTRLIQVGFLWISLLTMLVVVFSAFFDIKTLRTTNKFFVLPVVILNIAFATIVAEGGIVSPERYASFHFQLMFFGLELGAVLAMSIILLIENWKEKTTKKDLIYFGVLLIPMIIMCTPVDAFRVFTGNPFEGSGLREFDFTSFTIYHRIWLYGLIIIPIIIHYSLRNRDDTTIKFVLLFISTATMITFFRGQFGFLYDITVLPLHLCHTAMYIIPLTIIFKMKRLFYFTFFINVLGAIIAMLIPNYSTAMAWSSPSLIGFMLNHYIALFMPILMVSLRLYERPGFRQFKYSTIGFTGYFILILIVNAWFINYREGVNYFYANTEFVAEQLSTIFPFVMDIRDITLEFYIGNLHFVYYPVWQFLFWLGFLIMGIGMWFLYELGFQTADNLNQMFSSKKKIRMNELAFQSKLDGHAMTKPKKGVEKMLKITNFTKVYGSSTAPAVNNANLEVSEGEIFGFLGPNGSGKSTIIKSIVGIQAPTEGTIEVCGFDIVHQDVDAKRRIGFVPDHYALYEKLTGREYINYIADIYGVGREERDKQITELVEKLALSHAFDNQIKTYSHGMKQKIAIIGAIIHSPKLWILDEPLTGLDPTSVFQVKELMKDFAKRGNMVFFSSHIIDVVERICHRIAVIVKGEIKAVQNVSELLKTGASLEEFYLKQIEQKVE